VANELQYGYLVLADISGYTSYLAGVELTHAQDVLAELLELIAGRFNPLLTVSKFEGDAVFASASKTRIPRDETLLELFESTYLDFRDRVNSIYRRTTCQCNACKSISDLDMKFIVHFGEYLLQSLSGSVEIVGSDVNLVHRLLKNHVKETTGWNAYILLNEECLVQMDIAPENLYEGTETYDHLGQVKTFSLDLHARYKELTESRRVFISADEADLTLASTVSAPPVVVWQWMNDIDKRRKYETFDEIRPVFKPGGRTGVGARNHCAHGKDVLVETILDWRPFEYFTVEYPRILMTHHLEPKPHGTLINMYCKLKLPLPSWLTAQLAKFISKQVGIIQIFETMVRMIEEEEAGLDLKAVNSYVKQTTA
jgi:hypothetical protein